MYIKSIFMGEHITGIVLHENVEESVVTSDIKKYLCGEMSRIPKKLGVKLPSSWPPGKDLDQLVSKARHLFCVTGCPYSRIATVCIAVVSLLDKFISILLEVQVFHLIQTSCIF